MWKITSSLIIVLNVVIMLVILWTFSSPSIWEERCCDGCSGVRFRGSPAARAFPVPTHLRLATQCGSACNERKLKRVVRGRRGAPVAGWGRGAAQGAAAGGVGPVGEGALGARTDGCEAARQRQYGAHHLLGAAHVQRRVCEVAKALREQSKSALGVRVASICSSSSLMNSESSFSDRICAPNCGSAGSQRASSSRHFPTTSTHDALSAPTR